MTRTIVMTFLATLHARGVNEAVDTLLLAQAGKKQSILNRKFLRGWLNFFTR